MNTTPPEGTDPREFALQLAAVAARLDERSAQAVEQVEAASAALARQGATAAQALAVERTQVVAAGHQAHVARVRWVWLASAALLLGSLVAITGAGLALDSARRELDAIHRERALLQTINGADLSVCGERLCARIEGSAAGDYRPVAARLPPVPGP
ncbi:hypothetical protein H9645_08005 [Luteimonas sp. Sa2BVA3]|uniref:Uncharacterized protein n=1 Tax=Luteimonas colneyensis TaxID=2762230 RepID=A0ABR8UIV5_9GAMM|nr:hypothetical protein [Luteimonas colneyensis]MBD7987971.1 hypothetical protein [Luteimonas colneyensis]